MKSLEIKVYLFNHLLEKSYGLYFLISITFEFTKLFIKNGHEFK